MARQILAMTLFMILSIAGVVSAAESAGSVNFVIIEPGQPGTSTDAQPVMDALAKYVSTKLGKSASGVYFNEMAPALKYLDENKPVWGICGLTFFKSYKDKYMMTPVASTLPQGFDKDTWRILVPSDGPNSVRDIKGTVFGSMLYTPEARKILFGKDAAQIQLAVENTSKPLRKLRLVDQGKAAGVCLNRVQYSVIKGTAGFSGVKVVYESGKLPNSPVVWFGKMTDDAFRLQAILLDMKSDPAAAGLLKILQTAGFGPADAELK